MQGEKHGFGGITNDIYLPFVVYIVHSITKILTAFLHFSKCIMVNKINSNGYNDGAYSLEVVMWPL